MTTLIKRSLVGGEISPALYSRADLARYLTSLKTLLNGYIQKGGGATNRAGTFYMYGSGLTTPIGASTKTIPWEAPNTSDSYVLEFGAQFIRFIKNGELIRVSGVTAWSNATNYEIGDLASRLGVNYYCKVAHTNQQPPNATYWHPLDGDIYSIPTIFATPRNVSWVQDSAVMRLVYSLDVLPYGGIPFDLYRVSDTAWILREWKKIAANSYGGAGNVYGLPRINPPTNLAASNPSGGPSDLAQWHFTTVTDDGEESIRTASPLQGAIPTTGSPQTLSWTLGTWTAPFDGVIRGTNIYRERQGQFYFVAFTTNTSFVDDGSFVPTADADTPPEPRLDLGTSVTGTGANYPAKVGSYQQRLLIGNLRSNIQAIFGSAIGFSQNFSRRTPARADDSLLFQTKGRRINGIRHIVDIGALVVFTDSGEWIVSGGASGAITQSDVYPEQYGYNGASKDVDPIVIGSDALYIQAQGSIPRVLGFDNQGGGRNGFRDDDLSAFAEHIFKGKTVRSWTHQKTPHSIVWIVLNDGTMASLTYIKEQQILAFARHETDGEVEEVCAIPEGQEYAVYMIVKRNINGSDVRYMERMYSREFSSRLDEVFMDCSLSYDGRNTTGTTMTVSGGTNWDEHESLTLTASAGFFVSGDVDNEIWLTGTDGKEYRCAITAYSSATVVTVTPDKTIPTTAGLRNTATTNWAKAVDQVSGLGHLEGKMVSIRASGYTVASPNNSAYPQVTVASGIAIIDACFPVIHVGLPYLTDIETLDIESSDLRTLTDKKSYVGAVSMRVQDTARFFIGPEEPSGDNALQNMVELKVRDQEDWNELTRLRTDIVEQVIDAAWSRGGRVFIRQPDPEPITILSIAPSGLFPFRAGG